MHCARCGQSDSCSCTKVHVGCTIVAIASVSGTGKGTCTVYTTPDQKTWAVRKGNSFAKASSSPWSPSLRTRPGGGPSRFLAVWRWRGRPPPGPQVGPQTPQRVCWSPAFLKKRLRPPPAGASPSVGPLEGLAAFVALPPPSPDPCPAILGQVLSLSPFLLPPFPWLPLVEPFAGLAPAAAHGFCSWPSGFSPLVHCELVAS